jgi:hypothetical protein
MSLRIIKEKMTKEELKNIFVRNSDCSYETANDPEPAMSEEKFIEIAELMLYGQQKDLDVANSVLQETVEHYESLKNSLIDAVHNLSFMEPEQKKNFQGRLNSEGVKTDAEARYMIRCSVKALFDKAENELAWEIKQNAAIKHNLLNTPSLIVFDEAYKLESHHQEQKHGNENHAPPHHFVLVITHLLGKLTRAIWDKNKDKYAHHLITIAAVCSKAHGKINNKNAFTHEFFNNMKS